MFPAALIAACCFAWAPAAPKAHHSERSGPPPLLAPGIPASSIPGSGREVEESLPRSTPQRDANNRTPRSEPSTAQAKKLEALARQLRDPDKHISARAFTRLLALERGWTGVEHDRAALAIGYYDFSRAHYADALLWFGRARRELLLGRYALYWQGLTASHVGQDSEALALLGDFLRQYPDSVLEEQALGAYADAAIDAQAPDRAITALRADPRTEDSPALLVRLGLALERSGETAPAALVYQRVYNRYPLNDAAVNAERGIDRLRAALGNGFPEAPGADRIARAETLFQNERWRDARTAWLGLRDSLAGVDRDRADLRIAQCDAELHPASSALEALTLSDPSLDAQRWLAIFRVYRAQDDLPGMQAAVERIVRLAAAGAPPALADQAIYLLGNYDWAKLRRDAAAECYRRLLARHVAGEEADTADWRIAWTGYLENTPEAAGLFREHILQYPNSPYVPDALYWLGRLAERAANPADARAYYGKLSSDFAETYFGRLARARLRDIPASADAAGSRPVLDKIPAVPPELPLAPGIPAAVRPQYERALALRSIGFDDTAMLELRSAYAASKAPLLLVEGALAAQAARHYLTGAALVRLFVPDIESRPFDTVPADIWRIVYPLPYKPLITASALHYDLDPMLLASLVRQESGFQPDAVSDHGAVGLAQLKPTTARLWSRKLRLYYSRRRLTDPRYNLRVGGAYLQALIRQFGSVEAALAGYNAGEDRVAQWLADRHYDDPAEFVESIPFSQTRHYVEIVMNGAVIYRRLYEDRG